MSVSDFREAAPGPCASAPQSVGGGLAEDARETPGPDVVEARRRRWTGPAYAMVVAACGIFWAVIIHFGLSLLR